MLYTRHVDKDGRSCLRVDQKVTHVLNYRVMLQDIKVKLLTVLFREIVCRKRFRSVFALKLLYLFSKREVGNP